MKPLAVDLFCGLGGWTEGLLAEGYRVVGFDIERHEYGDHKYPAQLVIQDVLTLHGSQFRDAALIVASPPCQAYSYRAMPWKRAKELPPPDNTLFEACFRIQREACEVAGRHIPLVVENVRGAQKWVGRAAWHFGSFYLWGDIPALMPITIKSRKGPMRGTGNQLCAVRLDQIEGTKVLMPPGGDSLTIGFQQMAKLQAAEGFKSAGMNWSDQTKRGQDFTRIAGRQAEHDAVKVGGDWFGSYAEQKAAGTISSGRMHGSKSNARKAASAMIAKIPFVLAQHIARAWKPQI